MTDPDHTEERREMRRNSPDAPQGIVATLAILAGVVSIAVLSSVTTGFPWTSNGTGSGNLETSASTTLPGEPDEEGKQLPTSTLIHGPTTEFVTTTTPITTTTSTTTTSTTTTTIPESQRLKVQPGSVTLSGKGDSATLTITTPLEGPIGFFVTDVPAGVKASSTAGQVTKSDPAKITLTLTDLEAAHSGRIVIAGADGAKVPVKVVIGDGPAEVSAISISPGQPTCHDQVTLTATASSNATKVTATVKVGSSTMTLPMTRSSGSTWQVTIPAAQAGAQVQVTVSASAGDGASGTKSLSYSVASGSGC